MSKHTEALKFYADPNNWQSPSKGFALQYDPEPSPIKKDGGKLARNALKKKPFKRLTEKQVEKILVGCVKPISNGLHWDFKKLYEDLFEAITGEKHGDQE